MPGGQKRPGGGPIRIGRQKPRGPRAKPGPQPCATWITPAVSVVLSGAIGIAALAEMPPMVAANSAAAKIVFMKYLLGRAALRRRERTHQFAAHHVIATRMLRRIDASRTEINQLQLNGR
jgi:hypothetical protein